METRSWTLSASSHDICEMFVYFITYEVHKMQYLSNTLMFRCFHEDNKNTFHSSLYVLLNTAPSVQA